MWRTIMGLGMVAGHFFVSVTGRLSGALVHNFLAVRCMTLCLFKQGERNIPDPHKERTLERSSHSWLECPWIQLLSMEQSREVRRDLARRGELDRICNHGSFWQTSMMVWERPHGLCPRKRRAAWWCLDSKIEATWRRDAPPGSI